MEKFLERQKLPKLNQEKMSNMSSYISLDEIAFTTTKTKLSIGRTLPLNGFINGYTKKLLSNNTT